MEITDLNLPNLTSLGSNAFRNTKIQKVSDLGSITTLNTGVFNKCHDITSIIIPNTVTRISDDAVHDCTSLTTIVVGSGVTTISHYFLYNCPNLLSATFLSITPPTITYTCFSGSGTNKRIYVPAESVDAYKTAWSSLASYIEAIPTT